MKEKATLCIKRVGGTEICKYCDNALIKHGKSSAKKTRYRCKSCKKTQVENYTYKAYSSDLNQDIVSLTKEGTGIRSTARILEISTNTLLSRLIIIAKNIKQPEIVKRRIFQVDEMRTFIKRKAKLIWIVYALDQKSKNVVCYNVGEEQIKH